GVAIDPRAGVDFRYSHHVASKVALWVFMVVITALFLLFVTAYHMRMHLGDWRPVALPGTLWVSSALLLLASITLQVARYGATRNKRSLLLTGFILGGMFALAFIAAQWWVWQQLTAAGYLVASNPANSFFYLLTGLHAVHLLGGLLVWSKTAGRIV